jgi:hypothetical protein
VEIGEEDHRSSSTRCSAIRRRQFLPCFDFTRRKAPGRPYILDGKRQLVSDTCRSKKRAEDGIDVEHPFRGVFRDGSGCCGYAERYKAASIPERMIVSSSDPTWNRNSPDIGNIAHLLTAIHTLKHILAYRNDAHEFLERWGLVRCKHVGGSKW